MYSSPQDKCRIFNEHFANKSKLPDQLAKLLKINIHVLTDSMIESLQFTDEEVWKVIKILATAKATGLYGMSNTMLKNTVASISASLCSLENKAFSMQQKSTWLERS